MDPTSRQPPPGRPLPSGRQPPPGAPRRNRADRAFPGYDTSRPWDSRGRFGTSSSYLLDNPDVERDAERGDYDWGWAGTAGQFGQDEYGGEQYGGGRAGRGPWEQTERFGDPAIRSGRGPFGSLQRQFEERTARGLARYGGRTGADVPVFDRGSFDPAMDDRGQIGAWGRPWPDPARAPKGYRRSDERILEDLYHRIAQADHVDAADVTLSVEGGVVRLEGTVPERRMKYALDDLAHAAPFVQDVDNRLRVRRPGSDTEETPNPDDASADC